MNPDYGILLTPLNLAAAGALLAGLWLCIWGSHRRPEFRGLLCRKCGYDLRGQLGTGGNCPECGTSSRDRKGTTYGLWRRSYPMVITGLILLAMGLGQLGIVAVREISAGLYFSPYENMPKGVLLLLARHASASSEVWWRLRSSVDGLTPDEFRSAFDSALRSATNELESVDQTHSLPLEYGLWEFLHACVSHPAMGTQLREDQMQRLVTCDLRLARYAPTGCAVWRDLRLLMLSDRLSRQQCRQAFDDAWACVQKEVARSGRPYDDPGGMSSRPYSDEDVSAWRLVLQYCVDGPGIEPDKVEAIGKVAVAQTAIPQGASAQWVDWRWPRTSETSFVPANGSLVDVDVSGDTEFSMVHQYVIWAIREIRYQDQTLLIRPGAWHSYRSHGSDWNAHHLSIEGYAQAKLPPGKHPLRIILDVGLSDSMNEEAGWSSKRRQAFEGEAEATGDDDIGPRGAWLGVLGTWTIEVPVDLEIPDEVGKQEPQ